MFWSAHHLGERRLTALARALDQDDGRILQRFGQQSLGKTWIECWFDHRQIVTFTCVRLKVQSRPHRSLPVECSREPSPSRKHSPGTAVIREGQVRMWVRTGGYQNPTTKNWVGLVEGLERYFFGGGGGGGVGLAPVPSFGDMPFINGVPADLFVGGGFGCFAMGCSLGFPFGFHCKELNHFDFPRGNQNSGNSCRGEALIINQPFALDDSKMAFLRATGPFFRPSV